MTKRQEFRVIRTYDGFELREYAPCVIAEMRVTAEFSTASSAAFGSLFKYISQGNKASQKISMTAPVIAAQRENNSDASEWYVSFVKLLCVTNLGTRREVRSSCLTSLWYAFWYHSRRA